MGLNYTQGVRTAQEVENVLLLRAHLDEAFGRRRHLNATEVATPRHELPFIACLHLDACIDCARANKRIGGPWKNAVVLR